MEATENAHVEFERVCKSYDGRVQVVRDLDLSVYEGEFLTLLGASGSGKTTCLMMLAGFEPLTSGTIRIHGHSVHDLPPRKRGIGVVFQNYALFPHMTVGGNLAFPLEVRRLDPEQIRERVRRALQLVRLEGLEERRPAELSGGQQQRVAIARALVFEPSLVLMDEPLGALDRRLREEMQYELRRIQRSLGVTVVYVTHDQQEAMVLSDRVAVFRRGRIEQIAQPETLYEEPERPFVASFIGENNLLHGRVLSLEHDISRVEVGDRHAVRFRHQSVSRGGQSGRRAAADFPARRAAADRSRRDFRGRLRVRHLVRRSGDGAVHGRPGTAHHSASDVDRHPRADQPGDSRRGQRAHRLLTAVLAHRRMAAPTRRDGLEYFTLIGRVVKPGKSNEIDRG